jgi:hypothetical protein
LRRNNNRATAPSSEAQLTLMSEDGAMRFAYCALRTVVPTVNLFGLGTIDNVADYGGRAFLPLGRH